MTKSEIAKLGLSGFSWLSIKHHSSLEDEKQLFAENIPVKDLKMDKMIGEGAFGAVHSGNLYGQRVAVKLFKARSDNTRVIQNSEQVAVMSPLLTIFYFFSGGHHERSPCNANFTPPERC